MYVDTLVPIPRHFADNSIYSATRHTCSSDKALAIIASLSSSKSTSRHRPPPEQRQPGDLPDGGGQVTVVTVTTASPALLSLPLSPSLPRLLLFPLLPVSGRGYIPILRLLRLAPTVVRG